MTHPHPVPMSCSHMTQNPITSTPPTPLYFEYDHYEHTIHPPPPLSPTTTITPIPGNSIQTLPVPIIMDTKPHKPPLSYMPYQNLKLNSIPYTPHHPTEIITMTRKNLVPTTATSSTTMPANCHIRAIRYPLLSDSNLYHSNQPYSL